MRNEVLPAESEMRDLGGKDVPFLSLSRTMVRKILWNILDKEPGHFPSDLKKSTQKALRKTPIKAFTFSDGSVGVVTSSYHDSFYAKDNGDDFISAGQNFQLKKHAYPKFHDTKPAPTKDALSGVRATVEQEGFDYAFLHMSDFAEVDDKRFHELRKAYVKAAKELSKHLGVEA